MDARRRELERAFEANPTDQELLARLIAARRRAGEPVGDLVARERAPERVLGSTLDLEVLVDDPRWTRARSAGTTSRAAPWVYVPAARRWWVRPRPTRLDERVVEVLVEQDVPGLSLADSRVAVDQDLDLLRRVPHLRWLSLAAMTRLSDAGLERLAALPSLEVLDLSRCKAISARGLRALAACPHLYTLILDGCRRVDDAAVASLTSLPSLEVLSLEGVPLRGEGLDALAAARCLRELRTSDVRPLTRWTPLPQLTRLARTLRNHDLRALPERFPGLERVEVVGDVSPAAVAALAQLPRLRAVEARFDDRSLEALPQCAGLTELDLRRSFGEELTDAGLEHVGRLEWLAELDLSGPRGLTSAGLAHLRPLAALRRLRLEECAWLDDEGLRHIGALSGLEQLESLYCGRDRGITDAGLAHLAGCTRLRTLDLRDPGRATAAGLTFLRALRALRSLTLTGRGFGPETCAALADLGLTLERLELHCEGRGAEWSRLGALGLRRLVAWGRAEDVPELCALTALEELVLHSDALPPEASRALTTSLPRTRLRVVSTRRAERGGFETVEWVHAPRPALPPPREVGRRPRARAATSGPAAAAAPPAAVDPSLLAPTTLASRAFASALPLTVWAQQLSGELAEVGSTPSSRPLTVPACWVWGVTPTPTCTSAPLLEVLRRERVPGLSLARGVVPDDDLAALADGTELRWLSLERCNRHRSPDLAPLARLGSLQALDLSGLRLTSDGLGALRGLSRLLHLQLDHCPLDDGDLARIAAAHPALTGLSLRKGEGLSDDATQSLARLTHLRRLDLTLCSKIGSDRGLGRIATLPLTHLGLAYCRKVGDRGLEVLADGARGLEFLSLGSTARFTDAGLAAIARLRRLRCLRLFNCQQLSIAGLEALAALPALERLDLIDSQRLHQGVGRLTAALPGVQIVTSRLLLGDRRAGR